MIDSTSHSPWRERLREALYGGSMPVFEFGEAAIPAASIWTGSREWVNAFRSAGLVPGDRVVLALEPSPAFLAVLVAAIWEGLTVAIVDPKTPPDEAAGLFDASWVVSLCASQFSVQPTDATSPPTSLPSLRPTILAPSPDIRFLLRTSGTSGTSRTVALSDRGVLSVLDSHTPLLGLERESVAMSILPWHHSFGLVLDLLPALLSPVIVSRDPHAGRDADLLGRKMIAIHATHFNSVPLVVQRLFTSEAGKDALFALHGGIVGGAPVSASLARQLNFTNLRVGYGQSEASPGIALGLRGQWCAGFLGAAVGCKAKVTAQGTLAFRGNNAFLGYFEPAQGGLTSSATADIRDRWIDTGDLVQHVPSEGGYVFLGRADESFKLSNGRKVDAALLEKKLRLAIPGIDEAIVYPSGDDRIAVALTMDLRSVLPERAMVAAAIGPLASCLEAVVSTDSAGIARTPKGTVVRRSLAELAKSAA